jgi:hypothetical protein
MSETTGVKTTYQTGSSVEDRAVRYVDERIFCYAPSYAPILLLKGGIMPGPNGERIKVKGIIESQFTPSKKVEWYEKDLLDQDITVSAAVSSTSQTTLACDDAAGGQCLVPRVGDIIEVVTNTGGTVGEMMLVKAVTQGTTTSLSVVRAINSVTSTIMNNATIRVLGNGQKENSAAVTKRNRMASNKYNYMQIQRDDWGVSRSDDRIRVYAGRDKAETMADAAVNHVRLIERSLVFGYPKNTTDVDGNQVFLSGGLRYYISNIYGATQAGSAGTDFYDNSLYHGGTVDPFTEFLEVFCRYGFKRGNIRRKKIFIGGSNFANIFNRMLTGTSPATGSIRATSKDTSFGVQVTEIVSAYGTLDFLPSGAIDEFKPTEGYLLDPENIKFCYLDNTFMVDNAQNPDVDGYSGYFLTEFCLKVQGDKTHARMSGVTGPA